jgi:hypothetical protein
MHTYIFDAHWTYRLWYYIQQCGIMGLDSTDSGVMFLNRKNLKQFGTVCWYRHLLCIYLFVPKFIFVCLFNYLFIVCLLGHLLFIYLSIIIFYFPLVQLRSSMINARSSIITIPVRYMCVPVRLNVPVQYMRIPVQLWFQYKTGSFQYSKCSSKIQIHFSAISVPVRFMSVPVRLPFQYDACVFQYDLTFQYITCIPVQ